MQVVRSVLGGCCFGVRRRSASAASAAGSAASAGIGVGSGLGVCGRDLVGGVDACGTRCSPQRLQPQPQLCISGCGISDVLGGCRQRNPSASTLSTLGRAYASGSREALQLIGLRVKAG